MRVMAKITIPVESGSRAVKDGSIGKLIQTAAERWKPEAMYFGTFEGKRTACSCSPRLPSPPPAPCGRWRR
jgi:hypothetical protein